MTLASRIRCALVLLLFLVLTVPLAVAKSDLRLDEENAAMKSVGTPQAAAEAQRREEFGEDHVVLFMLRSRSTVISASPQDPEVARWLELLRGIPVVRSVKVLPTADAGALLLAVSVAGGEDGRFGPAVRRLLNEARTSVPPTFRLHAGGQPAGELALADALSEEQSRIVPAIAAVLGLLLLACYRHLGLAIGALLPAVLGICWTMGLQSLLGIPLDPVSTLLAPVLLTVGVAGSVHLIEAFLVQRGRGERVGSACRLAVMGLRRPALLAVATTAAGFMGLTVGTIPALVHLGLLATVGILVSALMTLVMLPAWLRLFARSPGLERRRRSVPMRGPGTLFTVILSSRPRSVVLAAAGLLCVFGAEWTRLRVDTDPMRLLPETHVFRADSDRIAECLGGVDTFDLMLPAPHPVGAPIRMLGLRAALEGDPLVAAVLPPFRRSPRGTEVMRTLLRPSGTTSRNALFYRAEERAHEAGWPGAAAAGASVQVARDSTELVSGQQRGMLLTLTLLWLAMAFGFRSWRLALLGLVPNVLPSAVLYGGLSIVDRPLSVASAMIGSVMLGLVVDDTIHFLHGFSRFRDRGCSRRIAVARTLRHCGRALVITSTVLACGFAVGLTGSLVTTREFGVLAAATVVVALAADLLLLPALLMFPGFRWKRASAPVPVKATAA